MAIERSTGFSAVGSAAGYRRDIDGLRAIAVIPVVLFHAEVAGFAGGFVGVDVFFVISGFLITQVLLAGAALPASTALADFYVRRCRRILPALVVMLATVCAIACVLLLPADLERFGGFLALAPIFLGNLAAWWGGGYFDTSGASLLHLWSIGIEEQFYLLYPLAFLLWLRGRHRGATLMIGMAAVISFALCVYASLTHPAANFYAPVTRAWELLAGALLAYTGCRGWRSATLNECAAWFALLALVFSFTWFHAGMRHPGIVTLIPCGATLLLLATGTGSRTRVARTLGVAPLVFTGLISYSLYLWHAPLLSLVRYFEIVAPSPTKLAVELAAIYCISAASWRWIERPLRRRDALRANGPFLAIFIASSVALSVAGAWLWQSGGWPARFSVEVRRLSFTIHNLGPDVSRCMKLPIDAIASGDLCAFGSHDPRRPALLVWGDSHALALLPAFRALADQRDLRLFIAGRSACRPLIGMASPAGPPVEDCAGFNAAMLGAIHRLDPDIVFLSGFWNLPDFLPAQTPANVDVARARFARALDATITSSKRPGRRLCAVLDAPDRAYLVPYALAMAYRKGMSLDFIALRSEAAFAQQRLVDEVFHAAAARGELGIVDPKQTLCAGEFCSLQSPDGWPLYNDADHLAPPAALMLVEPLARCARAG